MKFVLALANFWTLEIGRQREVRLVVQGGKRTHGAYFAKRRESP